MGRRGRDYVVWRHGPGASITAYGELLGAGAERMIFVKTLFWG